MLDANELGELCLKSHCVCDVYTKTGREMWKSRVEGGEVMEGWKDGMENKRRKVGKCLLYTKKKGEFTWVEQIARIVSVSVISSSPPQDSRALHSCVEHSRSIMCLKPCLFGYFLPDT